MNKKWLVYFSFIVLGCLTVLFGSIYTSPLNQYYGYDAAYYMVVGKTILNGKVLYRDIGDTYGPLMFWINALGFKIFNGKIGIFILQLFAMSISVIALLKILLLIESSKKVLILSIMSYFLMYIGIICEGDMTEEWALPFIWISFCLTLLFIKKMNTYPLWMGFLQGALFCCVLLIRVNNSAMIVGLVLASVIILIREKHYLNLLGNAITFLFGVGVIFLFSSFYFIVNDAFSEYINCVYISGLTYAKSGTSNKGIMDFALTIVRFLPIWIMIYSSVKLFTKKEKNKYQIRMAVNIIITSIVSFIVLQMGYGWIHYYLIVLPMMIMIWSIVCDDLFFVWNKKDTFKTALVLMTFLLPFGYNIVRNGGRDIIINFTPYYQNRVDEAKQIAEIISDNEKNNVLAYDVFPQIYLYGDFIPNNKLFAFQTMNIDNDDRIKKDFEQEILDNPPKWLIFQEEQGEENIMFYNQEYEYIDNTEGNWNLFLYRKMEAN